MEQALTLHLEQGFYDDSPRDRVVSSLCNISFEHAHSLRLLIGEGNYTSAIALMRLQFEAATRAIWFHFAASESWVSKFDSPLTPENQDSTEKTPTLSEMIKGIQDKGPPGPGEMLIQFKKVSWKAMNSFVHGGIHPLKRQNEGYPVQLIIQVIQNSNALMVMSGMVIALMSKDVRLTKGMTPIQLKFKDCLPPLLSVEQNPLK